MHFSRKVSVFHDRPLPELGSLVGYAFLLDEIERLTGMLLPLPQKLSLVTEKHQRYNTEQWQVFTKRHKPKDSLFAHIVFALKYEGIDLLILKVLFQNISQEIIEKGILAEPMGQYSRRIWFLYEWLMDDMLGIPDLKTGTYTELINPDLQYPGPLRNSGRHRVKNNLPGNRDFCPLIRRTTKLDSFINERLDNKINNRLKGREKELVRRTAAFLLLKDSKASFAIEGEFPPNLRARNWGKAIGQAGKQALSLGEIQRLQQIVLGSKSRLATGFRKEEGFIGEHDRETFEPIPDHISAKATDLEVLMDGLLQTNDLLCSSEYNPVLTAASIAFGFVFIHPFSDGNGRLHRYIIHHILSWMGYTKRDMIFPVSAAILDRISDYQEVLEEFSFPRLELIQWEVTPEHNIKVLNETIDLYRYADFTFQAEFLYDCVQETIETIIPEELDFLDKYDKLTQSINSFIELPNNKVDLLIKYLVQNKGKLSKRKRQKEFEELSDEEVMAVEDYFQEIYNA